MTLSLGAANRFPDKCDLDPGGARKINVEASKLLAETTSKAGILLIYISTDYVFPGKSGEAPYETDAEPSPPNLYGQTKLDGEKATLQATKQYDLGVVLRVPVLYGKADEPRESAVNVLMDALWKLKRRTHRLRWTTGRSVTPRIRKTLLGFASILARSIWIIGKLDLNYQRSYNSRLRIR